MSPWLYLVIACVFEIDWATSKELQYFNSIRV
jgi:hypothetical protein